MDRAQRNITGARRQRRLAVRRCMRLLRITPSGPSSNAPTRRQTPPNQNATHSTHSIPQCSTQTWRWCVPCLPGLPSPIRANTTALLSAPIGTPSASASAKPIPPQLAHLHLESLHQNPKPPHPPTRTICLLNTLKGVLSFLSPKRCGKHTHARFSIEDSTLSSSRRTDASEPESLLALDACCDTTRGAPSPMLPNRYAQHGPEEEKMGTHQRFDLLPDIFDTDVKLGNGHRNVLLQGRLLSQECGLNFRV
ncbi:hypothetical protein L210DRAFT_3644852 [Boletus edulis BED1]|uniref:Uncharacterized protein n=1 Tax=Boletus edulis BED1 TaxID=1328754 RepID=A0AAD4GFN3_BOLED|nr:hypothetical protein L210DRAFT_3644852 [Boletus edulis BED1]